MIFSDKQYAVSQRECEKLKQALATLESVKEPAEQLLKKAQADALRSQIADIEAEIAEYDLLRSGKITFSEASALSDLPKVLIQARIAKGLSQSDLAEQLDMKPQQIQRYEATQYMSISLSKLIEIADILNIKISETYEATDKNNYGSLFAWNDIEDVSWKKFPIKEMIKREWISAPTELEQVQVVRDFFIRSAGEQFTTALHRKKIRGSSVPNKYALLAWQARVLALAQVQIDAGEVTEFQHDDRWISELVALTKDNNGPAKAVELLAKYGIVLVTERHLPGTLLDGAAMLSKSGVPVIALTLRYDRLDNFWFVLFHELGHVFLHLMDSLKFDFFDEEDSQDSDDIEKEADQFALDALIPEKQWELCLSRFAMTEEAILIDAENQGISPSVIAGRIRKDKNDYTLFNKLIGQGRVRSQFMEDL